MDRIESVHNERVKRVRRLYSRRMRAREGRTVVEGRRLLEEVLSTGVTVEEVYFFPELLPENSVALLDRLGEVSARPPVEVSAAILRLLSGTEQPQGVVAVIRWPKPPADWREALREKTRLLLLDRIQNPTNLGSLIRTAAAFQVEAIFCLEGTADLSSPKVIRGSMGSVFRLPVFPRRHYHEMRSILRERRVHRLAAVPRGGSHPALMPWHEPWMLAVGNEACGLSEEIRSDCSWFVTIPMPGGIESLNVATAAAILLYESRRTAALQGASSPRVGG